MISNFRIEMLVDESLQENFIRIQAINKTEGKQLEYEIINTLKGVANQQIAFKAGEEYHLVSPKDILYAEVYQGELTIHTKETAITSRQTLKSLRSKLSEAAYLQISKSAIVQVAAIQRLEVAFSGNYYAFLKNDLKITVSRRFVNDLKDHLGIN